MVIVFDNRDNTNTIKHNTDGVATDWSLVVYMVLDLVCLTSVNSDVQLKTNVVGQTNVIDYSTPGVLIFSLGDQDIVSGTYTVELASVDSSGDITQLIHLDREQLVFNITSTETVT